MLKIIFLSSFTFVVLSATAQVQTQVIGDSVFVHGNTGKSELILQNSTDSVNGFLFNKGEGRTEFRRALIKIDDSTYLVGIDTLHLSRVEGSFTGTLQNAFDAAPTASPQINAHGNDFGMDSVGTFEVFSHDSTGGSEILNANFGSGHVTFNNAYLSYIITEKQNDSTVLQLQTAGPIANQSLQIFSNYQLFSGNDNAGNPKAKVVFQSPDILTSPPPYIAAFDGDTLKKVAYPVGGGSGGTLQNAFDAAPTAIPQINAHNNIVFFDSMMLFKRIMNGINTGITSFDTTSISTQILNDSIELTNQSTYDGVVYFNDQNNYSNSLTRINLSPDGIIINGNKNGIGKLTVLAQNLPILLTIPTYIMGFDGDGDTLKKVAYPTGGGSLTNLNTGYGLSGGPITTAGTIIVDSAALHLKFLGLADSTIYYPYASNPKNYLTSTSAWSTTGNAGTTSSNFIGTTDNQPLYFINNNIPSGIINGTNKTTSFGYNTLPINTGNYNSAFGFGSMSLNTTGYNNTAIGGLALYVNVGGYDNTSLGVASLFTNSSGFGNSAFGRDALRYNTTGNYNMGIGQQALVSNTTGISNTAIGRQALYYNTTGNYNIGFGNSAGVNKIPGGSNTLYISDSTYHMYYKLDSVAGTAPAIIGKDANGFWHTYQTPSGGTPIILTTTGTSGIATLSGSTLNVPNYAGNSWNLTGNVGTTSSNFIGTTDTNPLIFKVNNIKSGTIDNNLINVSLGQYSLLSPTGMYNSAIGQNSLQNNTSGAYNSAIGRATLITNTTGSFNSALGTSALQYNTTGNNNTASGMASLRFNTTGVDNAALGDSSLFNNSTGSYNIGLGSLSGYGYNSSNTLYISDSVYHMKYKLDSASGTAPSVIGKDANGFWHTYTTPSGSGGGTYTASNGLTMSGNDMQLGGTLGKNDTINTSTYGVIVVGRKNGSANGQALISVNNIDTSYSTGISSVISVGTNLTNFGQAVYGSISGNTGYGIHGKTDFGYSGVVGESSTTIGVSGYSNSGIGVYGQGGTSGGLGGVFQITPISPSTTRTILKLITTPIVSQPNGCGGSIDFTMDIPTNQSYISNQLISKWTTATVGARTSEFSITGTNNTVTSTLFTLSGNGSTKLNKYGSGTFTGTPTYNLSTDALGNIIETSQPFYGTATLASGTVTISTALVKTGAKIFVSVNTPGGTQGFLSAPSGSIVNGTSFIINSTSATDASTINWQIIN